MRIYDLIKSKYKDTLVLIKSDNKYLTYNNDAQILYYLFDYKIYNEEVSFDINDISKVKDKLKEESINYIEVNIKEYSKNKYVEILLLSKDKIFKEER